MYVRFEYLNRSNTHKVPYRYFGIYNITTQYGSVYFAKVPLGKVREFTKYVKKLAGKDDPVKFSYRFVKHE